MKNLSPVTLQSCELAMQSVMAAAGYPVEVHAVKPTSGDTMNLTVTVKETMIK